MLMVTTFFSSPLVSADYIVKEDDSWHQSSGGVDAYNNLNDERYKDGIYEING